MHTRVLTYTQSHPGYYYEDLILHNNRYYMLSVQNRAHELRARRQKTPNDKQMNHYKNTVGCAKQKKLQSSHTAHDMNTRTTQNGAT